MTCITMVVSVVISWRECIIGFIEKKKDLNRVFSHVGK